MTNGAYMLLAIAPVVTSRAPRGSAAAGGGSNGGSFTFGRDAAGGTVGGGVTTESIDGTTTEYRDDNGTRVPLTINQADISGVEVVVRRPAP